MSESVERKIILNILMSLPKNYEFSNLILNKALKEYGAGISRGFVTEVVNGVIRNMIEIEYIISQFSKVSITKMKPCIKNILIMSVYQILYMRVPESAAVNEAVKLTKQKGFTGLSGFVNGLLRNIIRNKDCIVYPDKLVNPINYLSIKYSYPIWLVNYFISCYGFEFTESLFITSSMPPDISLSVNPLKTNSDSLLLYFTKHKANVSKGVLHDCLHVKKTSDLTAYDAYKDGLFFVQDESSMLCVEILDPQPFEVILDVCAAPGGKSFRIAQKMKNKGVVISKDKSPNKVKLISESADRLGLDIIRASVWDATVLDNMDMVDRVLVDVPCSGLGLVRKKPDIKYSKSREQIEELVVTQRKILKTAAEYVKPNGVLVYSTCTLTDSENMENVKWILNNLPLDLCDITPFIPPVFFNDTAKLGYITLFPNIHGTDGFFIARFIKRSL